MTLKIPQCSAKQGEPSPLQSPSNILNNALLQIPRLFRRRHCLGQYRHRLRNSSAQDQPPCRTELQHGHLDVLRLLLSFLLSVELDLTPEFATDPVPIRH